MSEAELVETGMKCDYCDEDAVLRFRLMKLVRIKGRWQKVHSGRWTGGCEEHWKNANRAAEAGIRVGR